MNKDDNDKINQIIQTPEDILNEKKKELQKQENESKRLELQKDIIEMLAKNSNILESRKNFRELLEDDFREMIENKDEDLSPIIKAKLYEIVSNLESNAYANNSKIFTDLLKNVSFNIEDEKDKNSMTRENMQDISNVINFIKKVASYTKKDDK